MSPEAQRIAIAEACTGGFRQVSDCWFYRYEQDWIQCSHNDLIQDLNAMHEVEMARIVGNEEAEFHYRCALDKIMGHDRALIHFATAAQRAEAFLRAIGKWEGRK